MWSFQLIPEMRSPWQEPCDCTWPSSCWTWCHTDVRSCPRRRLEDIGLKCQTWHFECNRWDNCWVWIQLTIRTTSSWTRLQMSKVKKRWWIQSIPHSLTNDWETIWNDRKQSETNDLLNKVNESKTWPRRRKRLDSKTISNRQIANDNARANTQTADLNKTCSAIQG